MNKKKLAKSVVGIALIVSVAILIVVCVGKIKHMQARIKDNGIIKKIIGKDLKWLENAMNDAIDELLISEMISGYYTKCLFILREEMFDKAETMEERLNKKAADEGPEAATVKKISSLMMQTLWYAKYGKS